MTAFEIVFSENKDFIYRYLLKLSHRPDVAEELTQETFFRAYLNFSALREKEKAPVWLCSIAKNTYYAWYHDQKRLAPLDENCPAEPQDPPEQALPQRRDRGAGRHIESRIKKCSCWPCSARFRSKRSAPCSEKAKAGRGSRSTAQNKN